MMEVVSYKNVTQANTLNEVDLLCEENLFKKIHVLLQHHNESLYH